MQGYHDNVAASVNGQLIPISGAEITVYAKGTTNLATLYSDNGVTVTTNPVLSDSAGNFHFWTVDGRYDLLIEATGYPTQNVSDVLVEDPLTPTPYTLVSGTNIAVDCSISNNFRLVLAHNATLDNPTNMVDGQTVNIYIKQDATGGRTLAYGSKWKWPSGNPPTLSTDSAAVDFISSYYDSTDDNFVCTMLRAFS